MCGQAHINVFQSGDHGIMGDTVNLKFELNDLRPRKKHHNSIASLFFPLSPQRLPNAPRSFSSCSSSFPSVSPFLVSLYRSPHHDHCLLLSPSWSTVDTLRLLAADWATVLDGPVSVSLGDWPFFPLVSFFFSFIKTLHSCGLVDGHVRPRLC